MTVIDFEAARKRAEAFADMMEGTHCATPEDMPLINEMTYEFKPQLTVGDILKQLNEKIGARAIVQEIF